MKKKLINWTVFKRKSESTDLHAKVVMPDLQQYPCKPFLIKYELESMFLFL